MTGRNWRSLRQRSTARAHGTERAAYNAPMFALPRPKPKAPQPSKADLRNQAEKALAEWQARQRKPE